MLLVTTMGIIVLGLKVGTAIVSTIGIASGLNWFNKKVFVAKKGGTRHEGEFDTERFNRHNL